MQNHLTDVTSESVGGSQQNCRQAVTPFSSYKFIELSFTCGWCRNNKQHLAYAAACHKEWVFYLTSTCVLSLNCTISCISLFHAPHCMAERANASAEVCLPLTFHACTWLISTHMIHKQVNIDNDYIPFVCSVTMFQFQPGCLNVLPTMIV